MPPKTARTLSAGLVGAALLTGVGLLQPAVAYPPGTGLAVSASATSSSKPTVLNVTVSQAKPGCSVAVTAKAGGATASGQTVTDSSGSASFTLQLGNVSGKRATVDAKTVGSCSYKEKASTTVYVSQVAVKAPARVKAMESFTVQGLHYAPGSTVTFTAQYKGTKLTKTATANGSGFARANFTLPGKGTWVITGASSGRSASTTVKAV